jgi:hypothetical protein
LDQEIPDNPIALADYNISDGSRLILVVNTQTGYRSWNVQLDELRESVRAGVFGMSVSHVHAFFNAEAALTLRVPVGNQMGTLTYKLDQRLPDDMGNHTPITDPEYNLDEAEYRPDATIFRSNCDVVLPPECFTSRGAPARTVDTIVSLVDNLLTRYSL